MIDNTDILSTQYKIARFDETNGRIFVRYDELPNELIALDLQPTADNNLPVGEELHSFICHMAPRHLIIRNQALQAGITNADEIHALVDPTADIQAATAVDETPITDLFDVLK